MMQDVCLCGSKDSIVLFVAEGFPILRCSICGQVRTGKIAKKKRITAYTSDNFALYLEKEKEFSSLFRDIILFIKRFLPSGSLVDIGAGVGLLVREAKRYGFQATGFEISRKEVAAAKRYFGIDLNAGNFIAKRLPKQVDCVVINHVLEHVEEPFIFLTEITNSIKQNGILVVGVPNFGSFLAQKKKGRWQSLIPTQHRWHFTKNTLAQLIEPFGYRKIEIRIDNHSRKIHPLWKRPFYWILDTISILGKNGEAMLIVYKKIK